MMFGVERNASRLVAALFATVALIVVTTAMTLVPETPDVLPETNDKIAHALAFAALVFPLAYVRPAWWAPVLVGALGYGVLIELVQPYTGRMAELADLVADGVGALLGIGLALALARWRRRRLRSA